MEIEAEIYPIAVMGAGTMGRGIAQVVASAGHPVMLYDVAEKNTQDAASVCIHTQRYNKQQIYRFLTRRMK